MVSSAQLTASGLLLLALWVSVAAPEDVEPLGPVDLGEAPKTDATVAMMQKVVAQYQAQSNAAADKELKMETQDAVFKAQLDKSAAEGDKAATELMNQAGPMTEDGPMTAAAAPSDPSPVLKKGLEVIETVGDEAAKLKEQLEETQHQLVAKTEEAFKNKLQKEVLDIREKYQEEREQNPVAPTYREVPYFMYTHLSKKVPATSKNACEKVCSLQPKCQSFTWNNSPRVCYWSVSKLQYDNNYVYAAKLRTPLAGEPGKKFSETPGLRWTTPMSTNTYKVSWNECKDQCLKVGLGCQSVTYKRDTQTCSSSSESLPTSKHAYYYEKQASKASEAEQAAMHKAEAEMQARFSHFEAHEKAKAKEQAAQLTRETAHKKSAKEVYMKQEPDKAQEVKMKSEVESQVNAANAEIAKKEEAAKVKKQEKDMEANAAAKAALLKKMRTVMARQEKMDAEDAAAKTRLAKMAHTIEAKEEQAKGATADLDKQLANVKSAHEAAVEALQALKESEKQKAGAEAQDAAKLTIRTTHTKLQTVVKEAEFTHTKEVKMKKGVQAAIEEESAAAEALQKDKQASQEQRQKDKDFVARARAKMQKDAERVARGKYETQNTRFEVLKFKEVEAKKQLADAAAHQAAAEQALKNAKVDDKPNIRQHVSTYKEKAGKKQSAVKALDSDFKEQVAVLTAAKEKYQKFKNGAVKKKAEKDEERQIEDAAVALEKLGDGPLGDGPASR